LIPIALEEQLQSCPDSVIEQGDQFMFHTQVKVRFGDEDHAGIVYYPRFLEFLHCAFEDFFDEQGYPYIEVIDNDRTGWPTVRVEMDFFSPMKFGDRFDVAVGVDRLGTKSATFSYDGSCNARRVASAKITVACVDMDTFRAKPIPETYRALFEKHLTEPK